MEEMAPAGLPWGLVGKPRACARAGSSPRAGDRGSRVSGQPSFQTGCQRVLVPVQEPPARTCWPPALAAPARTVASAGSRKTMRASPAVAHPAGKVGAWSVWGFSTPCTSQLLREPKTERREGGQGPAAGRWLPACPAQCPALGRVLTCPTAQQGGWDAAIARTPRRGQFAARAPTLVRAVPKTSSSSPGAFASTSSPCGPRPALSPRSDLRD